MEREGVESVKEVLLSPLAREEAQAELPYKASIDVERPPSNEKRRGCSFARLDAGDVHTINDETDGIPLLLLLLLLLLLAIGTIAPITKTLPNPHRISPLLGRVFAVEIST